MLIYCNFAQVRVVQGREPRHFIKLWCGKMTVFSGGKASGFKNVHDHDTYDVDGTRMFRVRGTCQEDTRAVQVCVTIEILNFVVISFYTGGRGRCQPQLRGCLRS